MLLVINWIDEVGGGVVESYNLKVPLSFFYLNAFVNSISPFFILHFFLFPFSTTHIILLTLGQDIDIEFFFSPQKLSKFFSLLQKMKTENDKLD